jgi:hypothetical protein
MLRSSLFTLALLIAMPAALAEPLPVYESENVCLDVAGEAINHELILRGCMDLQQRTKSELELYWGSLPMSVQVSCMQANGPVGDYWKLKTCVDKEASFMAALTPSR